MERRNTQIVSDLLDEFFKDNAQARDKLVEARILNNWEKILGAGVASVTRRLSFSRGKLYVELTSAIVRNELLLSKQRIITRLNAETKGNVVKDLILR